VTKKLSHGLIAVLILTICCAAAYASANILTRSVQFSIDPQPLSSALIAFSTQSGVQVAMARADVAQLKSNGVQGMRTVAEALRMLLDGTGLSFDAVGINTVAITGAQSQPSASEKTSLNAAGSSGSTHLAQAESAGPVSPGSSGANEPAKLEEIIVTAQKRAERLQDVPLPVTAVSAETLINTNQLRLQDYYSSIPGLSVTPGIQSTQILAIRGITTGPGNPTVGVTVDDVPYGSSTNLGGGQVVPDIDPGDLARVEVLRGPQGALYGASSMGGLVKFVTADPSMEGLSGRAQVGVDGVYSGDEVGYNFRASVNVPLSDTVAIRASGFTRRDPGYIYNVQTGQGGVNRAKADGGRLSALWRPSDAFSLKLSALVQRISGYGSSDVDVPTAGYPQTSGLGPLQQSYLRGSGGYDRKVQAYSATAIAKFGDTELTAVSGYNVNSYSDSFDASYLLGSLAQSLFQVSGAPLLNDNRTSKFSEEIRLSVPIGERLEWLVGAFYTHEDSQYEQSFVAVDPATAAQVGTISSTSFPTTYQEYAAFTNLTLHITDAFDVQVGGRESENKQTYTSSSAGVLVTPEVQTKANDFTYLVTPEFKLSPDLMVYARLASGYRAGGPNPGANGAVPAKYDPDKTRNYELGFKGSVLDHVLIIDASLYRIDWSDIQLNLFDQKDVLAYIANGSRAKSQGIELSLEARPASGLTIAAWGVWNDAQLVEAFPAASTVFGTTGDKLPYTSRFSGNISLDQSFPLRNDLSAFVGATLAYVGDREGVFTGSAQRQDFPSYTRMDLRTGVKYDGWTGSLFVTNVTDQRGVLTGGLGAFPPFGFTYIQPRTVGVNVIRSF